nr:hypothetical protein [Tanacetum cinerariifolium]
MQLTVHNNGLSELSLLSAVIRTLTDVNINKLYQPWRSFAAIINKCLTRKSSGYDSLRLSQAQILMGLYHQRNIDYAYLMWEDFVYQVEHKNHKKSNEMYYPRFTKVIIHHFMLKDPSIPRRKKFDALLPIELINEEIMNSNAYKEYYAIATGAAPPKPKASVPRTRSRAALPKPKASVPRTRSSSDTTITPPTVVACPRLATSQKGKQVAKASKAKSLSALSEVAMTEAQQLKLVIKRSRQQTHISHASGSGADEGTGYIPRVLDVPTDESEEKLSWNSTNDEGDDEEGKDGDGDEKDDEKKGEDDEQEYDEDEYGEETRDEESFDPIPKTPENSDDEGNGDEDLGLNVGGEEGHVEDEEEDELYRDVNINQERGIQATLEVKDSDVTLTPVNPDGQGQSSSMSSQFVTSMLNPILDVGMESIFETTSQMNAQTPTYVAPLPMTAPTMTRFTIATITITSQAPILPTTVSNTIIQNLPNFGSLFGFDNRLRTLEANFSEFMQTNQFARASNCLRDEAQRENDEFLKTIDENMKKIINEQVKEQVKTSYAFAADLTEMELKKILIEKMKGNKPIQRSNEQRNLYKALVEAYESDKIILDTYGETTMPAIHRSIQSWISELAKQTDTCSSFNELMDTPLDFSNFLINRLKVDTLTSKLLAGPTYELMKGSCKSLVEFEYHLKEVFKAITDQLDWVNPKGQQYPHNLLKLLPLIPNNRGRRVIPFEHFINNDLEYFCGGTSSRKYTTSIMKAKAADYGHIKWIEDLSYGFVVNRESTRYVYSKRRIIDVTELKIVEWHNYKHLDWIMVRRDDDKLYKFKEGDFKRLRIQDIKDMLLPLVQGKLTNLTVEERFAFKVSLRMFTRSIIIQRRVEDLQLGVETYQKKLNLTKPDSDGTLTDVFTALDDRLKGIRMQYLPQSIWRKSDKDRTAAMI